MKISIIIPVYNEKQTFSQILGKVKRAKLPKGIKKEIIIVNDGSTDGTEEIVSKVKVSKNIKVISHSTNRGKGAALKTGLEHATGAIFLTQDADLEYDPRYYSRLLEPIFIGKTKVVYGSRLATLKFKIIGKDKTPLVTHYLANKFLNFLTNLLFGSNLTDMETGYKVFSKEVYEAIRPICSTRFDFEPEVTAKILKKGFAIQEVPITTNPRGYKEGKKITWKDGIVAIGTLFRNRFNQ